MLFHNKEELFCILATVYSEENFEMITQSS